MPSETKNVTIPSSAVVFFSTLMTVTAFFAGYLFFQLKAGGTVTKTAIASDTFEVTKSDKPEFQFYVMSFCPYGNQAEEALKPVAELLKDKADIRPQYIFNKIDNLDTYCKSSNGDVSQCAAYVQQQYFTNVDECKKVINDSVAKCMDEKSYIKASNGTMYASLHGRMEANQDIRELCAWNQTSDKMQWWKFIDLVNTNCSSTNADTCWEQQAKDAGFDTAKITECFNNEGIALVEKEIEATDKANVSGSPTFILNGAQFPGDAAYKNDGTGSLKIGKTVFTQDQYRTPNAIKEAICAAFKKAPKECKTELANLDTANTAAAAAGGCQ